MMRLSEKEMLQRALQPNPERILTYLSALVKTPSVVGYYPKADALLEEIAASLGYDVEYDNRHTAYIRLEGRDPSKTVCYGAHLDTIGLIVTGVDENGWLKVRQLGGINYHSIENENVYIHTRFHGTYTGMVIPTHHSVHVFEDARDQPRVEENMRILLDEDVNCPQDVYDLGIEHGDLISIEPRFTLSEKGYIKSRHIDDKANVAVLLEVLSWLRERGLRPAYNTWFAFPIYEEIGLGGTYIPEEVDAYIALDIGVMGPGYHGNEKKVSISAGDRIAPYDWALTSRLMETAREYGIDAVMDTYFRYASDATAGIQAGRNIVHALFGVCCMNSHSYERTHMEGIVQTAKLAMAAVTDPIFD